MDAKDQAGVLASLEQQSLKLASGGSAANTMIAIAQSGGSGVYCGKVAGDTNGEFYKQDMEDAGILFPVTAAPVGFDDARRRANHVYSLGSLDDAAKIRFGFGLTGTIAVQLHRRLLMGRRNSASRLRRSTGTVKQVGRQSGVHFFRRVLDRPIRGRLPPSCERLLRYRVL